MFFAPKEKGQGPVEYALVLVLAAIVVIAALVILAPLVGNRFSTINNSLQDVWAGMDNNRQGPANLRGLVVWNRLRTPRASGLQSHLARPWRVPLRVAQSGCGS